MLKNKVVIVTGAGGGIGRDFAVAMAAQLGALKDRTVLPDGSMIQWRSPGLNIPMKIAATTPEFPWTDLAQSLMPNGSTLDYVADAPYAGPLGNHRFGIQKQSWNASLYSGGQLAGFYAPTSGVGFPDVTSNLTLWKNFNDTGGPYDGQPLAIEQQTELPKHSVYYTDMSEPPAPALLSAGWNDDLFPVDETVRYYNKVRATYPNQAMKLFYLDFGHNPRAATPAASDLAKLMAAENAWFDFYIRGNGSTPTNSQGGADAITGACPAGTAGTQFTAPNWASLSPGEIRLDGAAQQQITAPGTAPSSPFTANGTTVCTTTGSADNASAATYKTDPAPAGGFTVLGSPTVIAEFDTPGANDAVIARLYDVGTGGQQQLIGRQLYRPLNPGGGFTKQVFQLHPQGWKILAGHVIKLELLAQDSAYARTSTGQHSVQVRNLQLRISTADAPGSAGGLVVDPADQYLPPGYVLARDVKSTVPGAPHITSGDNPNATGQFTLGWDASQPAVDLLYGLQHHDSDDAGFSNVDNSLGTNSYAFLVGSPEGEGTWVYRVNAHESDGSPATDYSGDSAAIKVDKTKPAAPTISADRSPEYAGDGGWYFNTVDVSVTDNGDPALADGSDGSGVDVGSIPATETHSASGSYTHNATVKDAVGNESDPATPLTVQVDATDPNLSVTCPSAVLLGAPGVTATITASDGESGLATDPSGTPAIDTSTVGPKTTSATAVDNVGHSVPKSCTTQVQYMFSGLLQPVNPDGSSVFKLNSTVPLKFKLTNSQGGAVDGAVANVTLAKVSNSVEGSYVEAVSTSNATTGTLFRPSGNGEYIFNLATKGLSTGTWMINVTLDDGTEYKTQISLR